MVRRAMQTGAAMKDKGAATGQWRSSGHGTVTARDIDLRSYYATGSALHKRRAEPLHQWRQRRPATGQPPRATLIVIPLAETTAAFRTASEYGLEHFARLVYQVKHSNLSPSVYGDGSGAELKEVIANLDRRGLPYLIDNPSIRTQMQDGIRRVTSTKPRLMMQGERVQRGVTEITSAPAKKPSKECDDFYVVHAACQPSKGSCLTYRVLRGVPHHAHFPALGPIVWRELPAQSLATYEMDPFPAAESEPVGRPGYNRMVRPIFAPKGWAFTRTLRHSRINA
ncbi:hypothetical protein PsYK624_014950 [Phanerochaete sordida]|uniref:Uncharacterized protein n=1 Tax=Phanerochaete sordida TaxID=48140 RepID=A0A9P3FZE1_9APHY|nr:hypothetical protein PsYK624_014950 [Phanerochaete sordida]